MKSLKPILHNFKTLGAVKINPLLTNFFSLGIIQGINFTLSIITFPYLVRIIGVEQFGIVTLLQTIMLYIVVFTDYGFNLSATKDISINRHDKTRVSAIFSEVIVTKLFLLFLSFAILCASLIFIPGISGYRNLTILSFTIVLGQLLQPIWFFQGIEQMKYITYINILNRALYAIGIFVFINSPQDYLYVNLVNGISLVLAGIFSLLIVFKKFKLKFFFPSYAQIKEQLISSWSIFFATLTVSISTNANIIILSMFSNPLVIGYYSIAEKTFQILRTFATILHQVVYPRICILAEESFEMLALFLNKLFKIILLAFVPLSLLTFALADYIVYFISGKYLSEPALILRIICFGPLMAALNIPAGQTMLAYKINNLYTLVLTAGAIVNVSLNFVLAYYYKATGTAVSIIITETTITCLLYYTLHRKYPHLYFFKRIKQIKSTPA